MQARLRQARGVGVTQTWRGIGSDSREWWFAVAIYAEPNRDLEPLQALQAEAAEDRLELPRQVMGVILPALEHDPGTRVSGQRLARGSRELGQMLIGQGQAQPVAPRFGEDFVQALREVEIVVELVQIEVEVRAVRLGPIRPMHRGLPEASHDK